MDSNAQSNASIAFLSVPLPSTFTAPTVPSSALSRMASRAHPVGSICSTFCPTAFQTAHPTCCPVEWQRCTHKDRTPSSHSLSGTHLAHRPPTTRSARGVYISSSLPALPAR